MNLACPLEALMVSFDVGVSKDLDIKSCKLDDRVVLAATQLCAVKCNPPPLNTVQIQSSAKKKRKCSWRKEKSYPSIPIRVDLVFILFFKIFFI